MLWSAFIARLYQVYNDNCYTFGHILGTEIEHRIIECPAHQKLQAEIINALAIRKFLALLSSVPFLD